MKKGIKKHIDVYEKQGWFKDTDSNEMKLKMATRWSEALNMHWDSYIASHYYMVLPSIRFLVVNNKNFTIKELLTLIDIFFTRYPNGIDDAESIKAYKYFLLTFDDMGWAIAFYFQKYFKVFPRKIYPDVKNFFGKILPQRGSTKFC